MPVPPLTNTSVDGRDVISSPGTRTKRVRHSFVWTNRSLPYLNVLELYPERSMNLCFCSGRSLHKWGRSLPLCHDEQSFGRAVRLTRYRMVRANYPRILEATCDPCFLRLEAPNVRPCLRHHFHASGLSNALSD